MPMKLSADDLREIATTLDKIKEVGLNVRQVEVRGHKVLIERTDHQLDGLDYFVIGLTTGEFSGKEAKVTRDATREPDTSHLPGGRRRAW